MIGWRYWRVTRAGLHSPLSLSKGALPAAWASTTSPPAICNHRSHAAPAPDCWCGWRVTEDLDVLIEWTKRLPKGITPSRAYGQVKASGTMLRTDPRLDPAGTWRVGQVRLVGPLLLSPRAESFAAELTRQYRCSTATLVGRGGDAS